VTPWRAVKVGDVCEQIRGVTYAKGDAASSAGTGLVPILRAGNITDHGLVFDDLVFVPAARVSEKQRLRRHDILIAASSGSLDVVGKAAPLRSEFDGGFGAFCKVLRPNGAVDPQYFSHFFKTPTYRQRVSALAAGANINNLRNEHLDDLDLPLPPLPEQRRIAAILDKADDLRAKRRAALAQLDGLAQSVFAEMFGDLVRTPTRWRVAQLGECVTEFRYGTSLKSTDEGKPALRIPNVIEGSLDITDLKCVPVSDAEFERLRLVDGDILFVRTNGNPDFVGRCAVFQRQAVSDSRFSSTEFVFASYLIRARLTGDGVTSTFLREFMSSAAGRQALRSRSKTSAGQFNINTEALASVPIPLPPLGLQREYERRLNAIRSLRGTARKSATRLDALFLSVQHRAFRGEL
jgi:type I restriction enzyme S subunit